MGRGTGNIVASVGGEGSAECNIVAGVGGGSCRSPMRIRSPGAEGLLEEDGGRRCNVRGALYAAPLLDCSTKLVFEPSCSRPLEDCCRFAHGLVKVMHRLAYPALTQNILFCPRVHGLSSRAALKVPDAKQVHAFGNMVERRVEAKPYGSSNLKAHAGGNRSREKS